jgi:putative hemolysin
METTHQTVTRRTSMKALALAFIAILLTGLAATPAGAQPRSVSVQKANDMVDLCFQRGGDPDVIMDSTGTSITVVCTMPNGDVMYCDVSNASGTKCTLVTIVSSPVPGTGDRQPGSRGQLSPGATILDIRPGTHLALSGSGIILVDNDR